MGADNKCADYKYYIATVRSYCQLGNIRCICVLANSIKNPMTDIKLGTQEETVKIPLTANLKMMFSGQPFTCSNVRLM